MSILDTALSLLAPHICVGCDREGAVLCRQCAFAVSTLPSICYVCLRATKDNAPCAPHTTKYSPASVYIAAEYSDAAKLAIKAYKFDYKRSAAKDLAFLLAGVLPYFGDEWVVSYVPATGGHVRERGFHHTRLIARHVAKAQGCAMKETLLRVTTTSQKGADRQTRKAQLKGAFSPIPEAVKNKKILLIDDVITTGATIEACTKELLLAGATDVQVAAIARTP